MHLRINVPEISFALQSLSYTNVKVSFYMVRLTNVMCLCMSTGTIVTRNVDTR